MFTPETQDEAVFLLAAWTELFYSLVPIAKGVSFDIAHVCFNWCCAVQLLWGCWFVNGSSRRLSPQRGRGRSDYGESHRWWALQHVTVESSDTELWGITWPLTVYRGTASILLQICPISLYKYMLLFFLHFPVNIVQLHFFIMQVL